jgi:CheY-like chemotaxis protein
VERGNECAGIKDLGDLRNRQFFKLPELAQLLGISHQAVHLRLLKGKIRHYTRTSASGNYLIPRKEAIRLLKEAGQEAVGLWTRIRKRVLLIDDYEPVRKLVEDALADSQLPLILSTAASAEDGLVLAATFRPHVIVIDCLLDNEGLRGDEAIAVIRRATALKGVRIIGISGKASARAKMLNAGANVFLQKPFHLAELMDAILRQAFGKLRRKAIQGSMDEVVSDVMGGD